MIGLNADLVAYLKRHRADRLALGLHRPEDWVFGTRTGRPLAQRNVGTSFRRARQLAKLSRGDRFHDLRHSHASTLLALGCSLTFVADRLGDTPGTITRVYGHLINRRDQEQAALAGLDAMTSATAGEGR